FTSIQVIWVADDMKHEGNLRANGMYKLYTILLILCLTETCNALPRHFGNPEGEGEWLFSGNRLVCELKQGIPYFGEVKFTHEHVKDEKTEVNSWQQHLAGNFSK